MKKLTEKQLRIVEAMYKRTLDKYKPNSMAIRKVLKGAAMFFVQTSSNIEIYKLTPDDIWKEGGVLAEMAALYEKKVKWIMENEEKVIEVLAFYSYSE